MWTRVGETFKRVWRPLVGGFGLIALACVGASLLTSGVLRGFVLGSGLALLVAAAFAFLFILSGATSLLSGAMAESTTATDLNHLKRTGWHLVHGFKLRVKSDIDHVAIGPGGVLVVETKWSADEWPADRFGDGYMSKRTQEAVVQTEKAVTHVVGTFGEVTKRRGVTRGVLVLSSPRNRTPWEPYEVGHSTVVMRAGSLEDWLATLPTDRLTAEEVHELARAVASKDAELIQREAALGTKVPPTLNQLINRWGIAAPLCAASTLLALGALSLWGEWWGWGVGLIASVGVVWRCWRWSWWRPALVGIAVGEAILSGAIVVAIVSYLLRN